MHLSNPTQITSEYKSSSLHYGLLTLRIESLLIDQSYTSFFPRVFQLKNLTDIDPNISLKEYLHSQKNPLLLLGEVSSFNKKKKYLDLCDGTRIYYKHLICIQGLKKIYFSNEWNEYFSSIDTLTKALKREKKLIRSILINKISTTHTLEEDHCITKTTSSQPNPSIQLIPFILKQSNPQQGLYLSRNTKIFCIEL